MGRMGFGDDDGYGWAADFLLSVQAEKRKHKGGLIMVSKITEEIVKGLVDGGLAKGIISTDFGDAVVRTALINTVPTFTITFPDMEEKWAVVAGRITGVKFNAADKDAASTLMGNGITAGKELKPAKPTPPVPLTRNEKAEAKEVSRKIAEQAEALTKDIVKLMDKPTKQGLLTNITPPSKKGVRIMEKPKAIKEQPPTVRAYSGKNTAKPKAVVKKGKITVPVPKAVSKKTGPVPKIGPKPPKWVRQLGSNGKPEKVDLNMYPIKIVCSKCGQPRYIDRKNAGNTAHPVTLCKPCQLRKKNDDHNAMMRARTVAKRAAEEAAAAAYLKKKADRAQAKSGIHR